MDDMKMMKNVEAGKEALGEGGGEEIDVWWRIYIRDINGRWSGDPHVDTCCPRG